MKKSSVIGSALCAASFMLLFGSCAGTSGKGGGFPPEDPPALGQDEREQTGLPVAELGSDQGREASAASAERERMSVAVYMAGEERRA